MKINHLKSTVLLALIFCLFTTTCFYSCDKAEQLDNTTWRGRSNTTFSNIFKFTIIISFTENNNANITAEVLDDWGYTIHYSGKATYIFDKNKITIKMKWDNHSNWNTSAEWTGILDNNTMTLHNVFNETVRFTKQ